MHFNRNKIILYMLVISLCNAFAFPLPIYNTKGRSNKQPVRLPETRLRRQVVQPTWLNFGKEPDVDPTVYINPQALFEAEELRKTIQKAVQENTFAVTDDDEDQNKAIEGTVFIMPPPAETNSTDHLSGLRNWYVRMQKFWRDWAQSLRKMFFISENTKQF